MKFPNEVRREVGYVLYFAQMGKTHHTAKMFKGHGSGIYEIVSDANKSTYRAVYLVNLNDNVYVLHAFQKKSKQGIKTPKEELYVIEDRLKKLKQLI